MTGINCNSINIMLLGSGGYRLISSNRNIIVKDDCPVTLKETQKRLCMKGSPYSPLCAQSFSYMLKLFNLA